MVRDLNSFPLFDPLLICPHLGEFLFGDVAVLGFDVLRSLRLRVEQFQADIASGAQLSGSVEGGALRFQALLFDPRVDFLIVQVVAVGRHESKLALVASAVPVLLLVELQNVVFQLGRRLEGQ